MEPHGHHDVQPRDDRNGCEKLIGKFNVSVEGKRRKGKERKRKGKEKEKEIEGRGKERNHFYDEY